MIHRRFQYCWSSPCAQVVVQFWKNLLRSLPQKSFIWWRRIEGGWDISAADIWSVWVHISLLHYLNMKQNLSKWVHRLLKVCSKQYRVFFSKVVCSYFSGSYTTVVALLAPLTKNGHSTTLMRQKTSSAMGSHWGGGTKNDSFSREKYTNVFGVFSRNLVRLFEWSNISRSASYASLLDRSKTTLQEKWLRFTDKKAFIPQQCTSWFLCSYDRVIDGVMISTSDSVLPVLHLLPIITNGGRKRDFIQTRIYRRNK